jgi:hypothetical protein
MLDQAVTAIAGAAGVAWAPVVTGIFGGLGSLARGWIDIKARKQEADHEHRMAILDANAEIQARKHELAMHEANVQRAEAESRQRVDEKRVDAEGRATEKDLEALIASQAPGATDPDLERIRAWVRIVLTVGSGLAVAALTGWVAYLIGGLKALGHEILAQIFLLLVVTTVSLASMAFAWWFGARPSIRQWMESVAR